MKFKPILVGQQNGCWSQGHELSYLGVYCSASWQFGRARCAAWSNNRTGFNCANLFLFFME